VDQIRVFFFLDKKPAINDFGRIRSLEKSITSRFVSINVDIEALQNKINQFYANVQRPDFDQLSVSNESEVSSTTVIHLQALPVLLVI
jgi:hypothetical protein